MDQTLVSEAHASIYLLAGVATAPRFFETCSKHVEQLCSTCGWQPSVHTIYPYGDHTRSLLAQVREVSGDVTRRFQAFRIGGRLAAEEIRKTYQGGLLILIGHSGGGAAAYQAARILAEEGKLTDCRIVQIGSPRVPILPEFRERVCYIHAVDELGRLKDPITKLGSWGGWTRSGFSLPRWNGSKYAPAHIRPIKVVGGHADYFRHESPFVDEAHVSNMDKTIEKAWTWLQSAIGPPVQLE
ncbi:hypothetical protein [Paenibacillus daejeonensis]|uniref:hypothetical protein n=1 Tax=Paenibacillus daejeonensis TaxID=135193 RepID=UPI00037A5FC0|nr:hypothetical protein [Paenibacillus daejeonensis]